MVDWWETDRCTYRLAVVSTVWVGIILDGFWAAWNWVLAQEYFGWTTALALECCVMGCRVYTGRWEIGDGDITRIVETGRSFIYLLYLASEAGFHMAWYRR